MNEYEAQLAAMEIAYGKEATSMLKTVWKERVPCLLCNRRPKIAALYIASLERSAELGAAPGKVKCAAYTLCRVCADRPKSTILAEEECEKRIRREQQLRAAIH